MSLPLAAAGLPFAASEVLTLTALPAGSLGQHTTVFQETGERLDLQQVRDLHAAGKFTPGAKAVLHYGIGARPVWVHLVVNNPTMRVLPFRLVAGMAWLDHLDVMMLQADDVRREWHTGDANFQAQGLTPGSGFSFDTAFAPGQSELYLRAESIDPLVLPLELLPVELASSRELQVHYTYGLIYGFLLALIAYNLMLYFGLGALSHLYYSAYLLILIFLNLAYTGHGVAWFWPGELGLQRYVIFVLMFAFSSAGLLFASRFLSLELYAPRLRRMVQFKIAIGALLLVLSIGLGSQLWAALAAFSFMSLFTVEMVLLGLYTISHGRIHGRYFLAAVLCGAVGSAWTTLSVWGLLPFSPVSYRAVEVGVILEAILLALALTHQVGEHQRNSERAENLARHDPLTGLLNRRAWLEMAGAIWSTAVRKNRPLALIMLDLDFFKEINDRYGHQAGDRALTETALRISQACRSGDLVARWGGEEFLIFLPETELAQATALAERIRDLIAAQPLGGTDQPIALTASFGVTAKRMQTRLEELISEADLQLYAAKHAGRNQVVSS